MNNKKIGIVLSGLVLVVVLFFLEIAFELRGISPIRLSELTKIKSPNLLINPNFKEDFKGWRKDNYVSLIETNGTKCISIDNKGNGQTRIWQNINVVSGKTYRLTFKLTGPDKGAFAIYRDAQTSKETYKWCNGVNNNKLYTLTINSTRTGKNEIYFSSNKRGIYCFSSISLYEIYEKILTIYKLIAISIIVIYCLFLMKFRFAFITLVLGLAIAPLLSIDKKEASKVENRNLSNYKSLFLKDNDGKFHFNLTYGIDFNNWLNDHFFLRKQIMKQYNSLRYFINDRTENDFVISGKNGFYFGRSNIKDIINLKYINKEDYEKTKTSIGKFKNFCQKNNIDLYIIVAPFGAEIYKENLVGINLNQYAGCYSNIIYQLKKDIDVNIIFAYDQLANAKNDGLIYYKTDHHWTELGGFYGYKIVTDSIKKKESLLQQVNADSYTIKSLPLNVGGTFLNQLNFDNHNNDLYFNYNYKKTNDIIGKWNNCLENLSRTTIQNKTGYKKKIFLFGDSFIFNYYKFFTHTFYETFCYYQCLQIYMPDVEKLILKYKPDIVVMNVYAENFKFIKNWYGK